MSSLKGLARETINYSDLVGSIQQINASLSTLEIFVSMSNEPIRRNNLSIAEHVVRGMMGVGKVYPGTAEFREFDEFAKRVFGSSADEYVSPHVF